MDALITRGGERIKFTLYDKDGRGRELESQEEFNFLVNLFPHMKSCIWYIVRKAAKRLDVGAFWILAKFLAKKALGREVNAERAELFNRISGIAEVGIDFRKKKLRLGCSGRTFNLIYQVFIQNQYDVSEKNVKGKIVADVGANIGDFSLFCACYGAKKVYAFEPLGENFKILQDNIARSGFQNVIVPVKKGLGDRNFSSEVRPDEDVHLGGAEEATGKTEKIEIVALDDFLGGGKIDFLKMDVEGYEENVLLGAKETIRKFKPVLSFSAYHKPTDKTRLPEILNGIRGDYSMKLNYFYEEDFYCE